MQLTARPANCFSRTHLITMDGRSVGELCNHFWGHGFSVRLTQHRRWHFKAHGWIHREYELTNEDGEVFGRARRRGVLRSGWELDTSVGPCQLERHGWLHPTMQLIQDGAIGAEVSSLRGCASRGWQVDAHDPALNTADLLLVGLVFHTVKLQQQQTAASS